MGYITIACQNLISVSVAGTPRSFLCLKSPYLSKRMMYHTVLDDSSSQSRNCVSLCISVIQAYRGLGFGINAVRGFH